ncbi:arylesterase [Rhodohalobacter sp. 8-1]|uniref:arylesterase n=1 Tax=Rhodohalobacter sp. 8-1 TaxID=3131972 RepID=UPI0030EF3941
MKREKIAKVAALCLFLIAFNTLWAFGQNKILMFGDSITAGYGLGEEQAYPAFIQDKIDSLDLNYTVVNAGLSGETTAGGARRVDWILQQEVDIFLIGLGGNDGLRGIDPSNTKKNLITIIEKVREKDSEIDIILAGMEAPPNLGQQYTSEFRSVFREVANEKDVTFMPFLLEDVAGNEELNQPDGIHPTAEGQQIIANNIWPYLKPLL